MRCPSHIAERAHRDSHSPSRDLRRLGQRLEPQHRDDSDHGARHEQGERPEPARPVPDHRHEPDRCDGEGEAGGELHRHRRTDDDLLIDDIKFSPEFTKAIEDKQIATQEAQAAKNKVAQAEYQAQQIIKQAQGQAEANRLKRQTLTPLLVQQNAIDKLNPNVTVIMVPSNSNFLFPNSLLQPKTP